MAKIRWTNEERDTLLELCKKMFETHSYLSTRQIVEHAQLNLPADRRRKFAGSHNYKWIVEAREKYVANKDKYVPIKDRPIFVEELPPEPPKPDIMSTLTDILADVIVKVFAEAIVKARARLDLPIVEECNDRQPEHKHLKNVAVYGLFSNQQKEVRKKLDGLLNLRFVKDISQDKMISAAQWADHFVLMTKFVSHDYEAIKKYKNLVYCNGGVSSLISQLEDIYLGDTTKP